MKTLHISINIYTPKELWVKFWNRFYWPRRKQCAEWMDVMQVRLEGKIVNDLIYKKYYDRGSMGFSLAESLDIDIKNIIWEECEQMKKTMSMPLE